MAAKISQMTPAATLTGAELLETVQGGASVQTTTQAVANAFKGTRGTAIASAATVDLGAATGTNLHITGTTTITSFGTAAAGVEREVIFDGAVTLTHNGTSLILPGGANRTTAAGDSAKFVSEGAGNWRCVKYQRADGKALVASSSIATTDDLAEGSTNKYYTDERAQDTVASMIGAGTHSGISFTYNDATNSLSATVSGTGGGGGGGLPGGYAQYLAAGLEPDAIEAIQKDTFSYAIGSSTTKLLLASWQTRIGSAGRMEARNPQRAIPLRGVTLNGTGSGSGALILDPAAAVYADPWTTYYNRLQSLYELQTRVVNITAASQGVPLLPGPYGAIITSITNFNFAWLILRWGGTSGPGFNLWDEISDASTQRLGDMLLLPVSKSAAGDIESSSASSSTGGSPLGTVTFVLVPSTWSAISDPLAPSGGTYTFQDDFMGAALDTTTVWTRAQSTTGNVEIDTNYQWCKCAGNGTWGTNGLRRQTSNTRATGLKLVWDVYVPRGGASTGTNIVGWSNGASHQQSDFCHGVNFAGTNIINVYEGGTNRGTVGSGYTEGCIYRIRITLGASNNATYEIQGGREYPKIGGASWTNITPGTTSNATTTLYAAASAWNGSGYVSHPRIYS